MGSTRLATILPASVLWALLLSEITWAAPVARSFADRPPHWEYAKLARWLIHANDWGVVSTTSQHLGNNIAFGNAVSYSDGPLGDSTGRLLFYLTLMDATAQDLEKNPMATLTVCEAQLPGACRGVDPEDPTCAKLSITGNLAPVPEDGIEEAKKMLFARHPDMAGWPAGHAFKIYELKPTTLRLLDYYGGPHDISPEDYFRANGRDENQSVYLHES